MREYRDERVGVELQQKRFEEAKATLEEITEKNENINFNNDHPALEDALTYLRFEKEEIYGGRFISFAFYRDTEKEREVLTSYNLHSKFPKKMELHLYRIPIEQEMYEWDRKINPGEWDSMRKTIAGGCGILFSIAVGVITFKETENYLAAMAHAF